VPKLRFVVKQVCSVKLVLLPYKVVYYSFLVYYKSYLKFYLQRKKSKTTGAPLRNLARNGTLSNFVFSCLREHVLNRSKETLSLLQTRALPTGGVERVRYAVHLLSPKGDIELSPEELRALQPKYSYLIM
jgi:hypothetical protein